MRSEHKSNLEQSRAAMQCNSAFKVTLQEYLYKHKIQAKEKFIISSTVAESKDTERDAIISITSQSN